MTAVPTASAHVHPAVDQRVGRDELRSLPAAARLLLVTDGTVTHMLEALHLEDIEVQCIDQRRRQGDMDTTVAVPVDATGDVIRRRVALRGAASGTVFVVAESLLLADRLPPEVVTTLEAGTAGGIGDVLSAQRVEVFREILAFWTGPTPSWAQVAGDESWPRECVSRTYQIVARRQPVMIIREWFLRLDGA